MDRDSWCMGRRQSPRTSGVDLHTPALLSAGRTSDFATRRASAARSGGRERLAVEGAENFRVREGALADDGPLLVINANDGRGENAAGIAGIKNERDAIAELLQGLPGTGTRTMAGEIRARARHGTAHCFD